MTTQCFCLCHNSYAQSTAKAPSHDPKDCECMKKAEDPTLRAKVDIQEQIEEQLLQKARMEEALRYIVEHREEWPHFGDIAANALEPTTLCVACRKLTTHSPCVNCGKS